MQPRPSIGEANRSALIGAAIGSIGGLFALGLAPAIMYHSPEWIMRWPKLNLFSFCLCGTVAWLLGGQIGPRLLGIFGLRNGLIIGGIIGGLMPVAGIVAFGWYGTRS
jgi:hypothetical protein